MLKSRDRKLWFSLGIVSLALVVSAIVESALVSGAWPYEIVLAGAGIAFLCLFLFLPRAFHEKKASTAKKTGQKTCKLKALFASKEKTTKLFFEAFAVALNLLFIVRFLWGHDYLETFDPQTSARIMSAFSLDSGAIFLCYQAVIVFFIVGHEFWGTPRTDAVVKWICAPVLFVSIALFPNLLRGMLGDIEGFVSPRGFLFALEVALEACFVVKAWLVNPKVTVDKSEAYAIVAGLIILFVVSINDYLPKNLIGEKVTDIPTAKDFSWTHRLFIYLTFILPVGYFSLLYPFDYGHRRYFLFVIASGVLFAYASVHRYDTWTSIPSMPLHLCNTAMYIMPLTLAFKNYKLFYFTMFVNVIGAFFALLMPNFSSSRLFFANQTFQFYINHMYATFMPILIILLGIYERPKWKYFLYSMAGFLIYFLVVVTIDVYYQGQGDSGVDFFFLNSDFIADKLGSWAESIYKANVIAFVIDGAAYTVRLVYLLTFFFTYAALSLAMWFVYDVMFAIIDERVAIKDKARSRRERKKLFAPTPNHSISLIASHVTKTYPGNEEPSLIDFSIRLSPGRIYGFLGNNGAGKSTFIKAAVGLHDFEEGTIRICGYDIAFEASEAKSRMAYVPDHYALEESLTGREYVSYMASLYRVKAWERERLVGHYLPILSLDEVYDRPMRTYSHGMKQKITLLGALVHSPKVIILDEPLTGVDPESVYEIKKVLLGIAKEGRIVFFSSHMIDIVEAVCDEVIIIKSGRYVDTVDIKALCKRKGADAETVLLSKLDSLEEKELFLEAEKS
jgi:ABC-2 type transport system ATP-binding protein